MGWCLMPIIAGMEVEDAATHPWIPAIKRSGALKRDLLNVALVAVYESESLVLNESDWVYLQAVLYAEQIHPYTLDQIGALGPIEGPNAARWTIEGPTSDLPGEPQQCDFKIEVAHSLMATSGTDWRAFRPGKFKLRSCRLRLTITRYSLDFDFRVYRFAIRANRIAPPQRDWAVERYFNRG